MFYKKPSHVEKLQIKGDKKMKILLWIWVEISYFFTNLLESIKEDPAEAFGDFLLALLILCILIIILLLCLEFARALLT